MYLYDQPKSANTKGDFSNNCINFNEKNLNSKLYNIYLHNITKTYHVLEVHVTNSNIFYTTDPTKECNMRKIEAYENFDNVKTNRNKRGDFIILQTMPFIIIEWL